MTDLRNVNFKITKSERIHWEQIKAAWRQEQVTISDLASTSKQWGAEKKKKKFNKA